MISFLLCLLLISFLFKVCLRQPSTSDPNKKDEYSFSSLTRSPHSQLAPLVPSQSQLRHSQVSRNPNQDASVIDQLGRQIEYEANRQRGWLQNPRVNQMRLNEYPQSAQHVTTTHQRQQRGLFNDDDHPQDEAIVPPEDPNGTMMVGTIKVPNMNQTTLYSLGPNATLSPGQSLRSRNDIYTLEFNENGILALMEYKAVKPIWSTSVKNDYSFFIMEDSGSLVQYVGDAQRASNHGRELWSTHSTEYQSMTENKSSVMNHSTLWVYATVLDIGVFVIFSYHFANKQWKILWHTPDPAHPSATQRIMNSLDSWVQSWRQ